LSNQKTSRQKDPLSSNRHDPMAGLPVEGAAYAKMESDIWRKFLAGAAAAALGVVPQSSYADSDPSIPVGVFEDVKRGDFWETACRKPFA
jgi:hypothetical protein